MTKPIRLEHFQPCVAWWGSADRRDRVATENAWCVDIGQIKARNYNLDVKNPHTVAADHGDPAELLVQLAESEAHVDQLRDQLKAILAEALLR